MPFSKDALKRHFTGAPKASKAEQRKRGIVQWALGGGIPAEELAAGDITHIQNYVLSHDHRTPLDEVNGLARAIVAAYRIRRPHLEGVDHREAGE